MSALFPMKSFTEEANCGGGSDCKITLNCNNRRFIVLLSREPSPSLNTPGFIECTYLKTLDSALESEDPRELTTIVDEISGFLATLCQPMSQEFASLTGDEPEFLDVEACINPETYKLQLMMVDKKPKVVRRNGDGSSSTIPSKVSSLDMRTAAADLRLPNFPSKELKVLQKYRGTSIMKVSAGGRVLCCKIADAQTHLAVDREIRCLR